MKNEQKKKKRSKKRSGRYIPVRSVIGWGWGGYGWGNNGDSGDGDGSDGSDGGSDMGESENEDADLKKKIKIESINIMKLGVKTKVKSNISSQNQASNASEKETSDEPKHDISKHLKNNHNEIQVSLNQTNHTIANLVSKIDGLFKEMGDMKNVYDVRTSDVLSKIDALNGRIDDMNVDIQKVKLPNDEKVLNSKSILPSDYWMSSTENISDDKNNPNVSFDIDSADYQRTLRNQKELKISKVYPDPNAQINMRQTDDELEKEAQNSYPKQISVSDIEDDGYNEYEIKKDLGVDTFKNIIFR